VFRNTQVLAQVCIIYSGLAHTGIQVAVIPAAVIRLGFNGGAILTEIIRSGFAAAHKGQPEAALSVGMTPIKSFRCVILPQAMRIILPPLLNMLIILLKDTSICSLISTPELMLRTRDLAWMSFLPMHLFLLAALMYFLMSWPLSIMTRRIELLMQLSKKSLKP